MINGLTLLILPVLALAVFWILMFAQMMAFGDELYNGRYDKILWTVVFLLAWPVAPFAFAAYKSIRLAEVQGGRK